jgi:hypothetical protein
MGPSTVLWAGKRLTDAEELTARRIVALLERTGDEDAAEALSRFLPERAGDWTPDQLELGAHAGPWLSMDAGMGGGGA